MVLIENISRVKRFKIQQLLLKFIFEEIRNKKNKISQRTRIEESKLDSLVRVERHFSSIYKLRKARQQDPFQAFQFYSEKLFERQVKCAKQRANQRESSSVENQ